MVTYTVRVKDTFCSVRGEYEEECVTNNREEALSWFTQWKGEYKASKGYEGFKVTMKESKPAIVAIPALTGCCHSVDDVPCVGLQSQEGICSRLSKCNGVDPESGLDFNVVFVRMSHTQALPHSQSVTSL